MFTLEMDETENPPSNEIILEAESKIKEFAALLNARSITGLLWDDKDNRIGKFELEKEDETPQENPSLQNAGE